MLHSRLDAWMHQWDLSVILSNKNQITQKPPDANVGLRGAAGDVGPHYGRQRPASNTTQASQPKKCIPTPSKAEGEHPQLWQPKTSPRTAASPQKQPRTTATRTSTKCKVKRSDAASPATRKPPSAAKSSTHTIGSSSSARRRRGGPSSASKCVASMAYWWGRGITIETMRTGEVGEDAGAAALTTDRSSRTDVRDCGAAETAQFAGTSSRCATTRRACASRSTLCAFIGPSKWVASMACRVDGVSGTTACRWGRNTTTLSRDCTRRARNI